MAITLEDDSVILDAGIRLKFLRDAEYDPAPPLVAFDGDEQTLLQCTTDGKLKVQTELSVPEINIAAVEIEDRTGGASLRVDVAPIGGTSSGTDNNHGFLSMGVDDNGLVQALPIVDLGGSFAVPVDIQDAELTINTDGTAITQYGEILSVEASDGEQIVVKKTVAAGAVLWLRHGTASGGNVATYRIRTTTSDTSSDAQILAGAVQAKKRSYFTNYNVDFFFGGDMSQGQSVVGPATVAITVEHSRPATGSAASISRFSDFNATIYGREDS